MKTVVLTCDGCGLELKDCSAALTLFDGRVRRDFCTPACFGDWRVRSAPRDSDALQLRPARESDSQRVWEWANDPQTRKNSFNPAPIPWEDHEEWFAHQSNLYVGWVPVGSVRVDDGEISVNVAPVHRGRGYGEALIRAATRHEGTTARIQEHNTRSIAAFSNAGYTELERKDGVVRMAWVMC